MKTGNSTEKAQLKRMRLKDKGGKDVKLEVNKIYKIKCTDRNYCAGQTAPYPFWDEQYVPVKVVSESNDFYTVRTLSHTKPISAWGEANPYTVSIDKHDLRKRIFIVKEE